MRQRNAQFHTAVVRMPDGTYLDVPPGGVIDHDLPCMGFDPVDDDTELSPVESPPPKNRRRPAAPVADDTEEVDR